MNDLAAPCQRPTLPSSGTAPRVRLHLDLRVSDLDRSIAFYAALFAAPPDKVRPGWARFLPDQPAVGLTLSQRLVSAPPRSRAAGATDDAALGLTHLGLQYPGSSELAEARRRVLASGLARQDEGEVVCCHSRQDKSWVVDPDGHPWELYVVLDEEPGDEPSAGLATPADRACCC